MITEKKGHGDAVLMLMGTQQSLQSTLASYVVWWFEHGQTKTKTKTKS